LALILFRPTIPFSPKSCRWQTLSSLTEAGQSHLYLVKDRTAEYPEPCVLKRVRNANRAGRFHDEVEAIIASKHRQAA
jgi:hypothetical protein